jgi:hypothetical protein
MSWQPRSKYQVVFTVHLDNSQRELCLEYAKHLFGPQNDPRPGATINHLFEMRGRNALLEAWEYSEQLKAVVAKEEAVAELEEQGGLWDDEAGTGDPLED